MTRLSRSCFASLSASFATVSTSTGSSSPSIRVAPTETVTGTATPPIWNGVTFDEAADLLAQLSQGVRVAHARRDHAELLTAAAEEVVGGAEDAADPIDDRLEQRIAALPAVVGVDALEVVDVEDEQRGRDLAAAHRATTRSSSSS